MLFRIPADCEPLFPRRSTERRVPAAGDSHASSSGEACPYHGSRDSHAFPCDTRSERLPPTCLEIVRRYRDRANVKSREQVRIGDIRQYAGRCATIQQAANENSNVIVGVASGVATGARTKQHDPGNDSGHCMLRLAPERPKVSQGARRNAVDKIGSTDIGHGPSLTQPNVDRQPTASSPQISSRFARLRISAAVPKVQGSASAE
jgi:hypothetical protein